MLSACITMALANLASTSHVGHTGIRPKGTLSASSGQINSQGSFSTVFTASHFSGQIEVTVKVGSLTRKKTINVRVPSLILLGSGTGYQLVGSTATHPVGWYGTTTAINGLKAIALEYKQVYYDTSGISQPSAERIRANDMSVFEGGKFDLTANWCVSCSHNEHTVGRNSDLGSSNVPVQRHGTLEQIIINNGSPNFLDEVATASHWHLRF